jgi:hypothetical protein
MGEGYFSECPFWGIRTVREVTLSLCGDAWERDIDIKRRVDTRCPHATYLQPDEIILIKKDEKDQVEEVAVDGNENNPGSGGGGGWRAWMKTGCCNTQDDSPRAKAMSLCDGFHNGQSKAVVAFASDGL